MYFEQLSKVKAEMIANNSIDVLKDLPVLDSQRPVHPSALRTIKRDGFPELDKDLLKLAADNSMCNFYWRWKTPNEYGGEIGLQSLPAVFTFGWDNKIWFDEHVWGDMPNGKEWNAFSRKLYGFDEMEESYDSTRIAAFYIDKEKLDPNQLLNPEVWLWDSKGPSYKLTLNYSQYLDKILVTRGFFGWQTFFLDWDGMDFNDPFIHETLFAHTPSTANMEEFLEIMPKIFPDQDYTEYQQLYDNWKKKAKEKGF